jgi:hypothetical protein
MEAKREMKTFDDLFAEALQHDKGIENQYEMKDYFLIRFHSWLHEKKGWEAGNEKLYIELLTKENWIAFRRDELREGKAAKEELENKTWPIEPEAEQETENDLPKQLIKFNNPETVNEFHAILKGFFVDREMDLNKALQGEKLETPLLFPNNQNKFVEVFRRAKYNGYLISSPTEIRNWLCSNFEFRLSRGKVKEIRKFNHSTVWDILTKGKNEPPKNERICFEGVNWLPYKSKTKLDKEAQKEKL